MKDLTIEEWDVLLCSTGYLPPRNEEELDFFDEMYDDYNSRIVNRHVDVDMILRGACRDYSEYHNRIAPKMIKNEFFSFDNKIFRYIDGMMVEYTRTDNETDDYLLTSYKSIPNFNRDLDRCENVLACLLNKVSKIKKQKLQKSKQTDVSLTEEERLVLAKMIGTFKE